MTLWPLRQEREAALKALEATLVENPVDLKLQFERACILAGLGQTEEAKQAYLKILTIDPAHFEALNNLGALLYETGYRSAARTVYKQLVAHYPDKAITHVNLANLLLGECNLDEARRHYEEALRLEPNQPQAHQGLTRIYSALRDEEGVARHRERGFRNQGSVTLPYLGKGPPVQLLLLVAAEGGNIPLRQHIDNHVFATMAIFPEFYDPQKPLPPHQLVFNTIGDADLCGAALAAAEKLLEKTTAPVINPPAQVIPTGRLNIAQNMARLENVKTARTCLLSHSHLTIAALEEQGLRFPLLLRPPGFHTGQHFVKVDKPGQLTDAVEPLPGKDVLAMEYLDARGVDNLSRKYRVMMIGGKLYPLHLAVSDNWKVHYFTASMARHQEEEKRFLKDMRAVIGAKGLAALERIKDQLDLDYGGMDFGLDAEGNILLFEANATMVINPVEESYRQPAIENATLALRNLLLQRAGKIDSL